MFTLPSNLKYLLLNNEKLSNDFLSNNTKSQCLQNYVFTAVTAGEPTILGVAFCREEEFHLASPPKITRTRYFHKGTVGMVSLPRFSHFVSIQKTIQNKEVYWMQFQGMEFTVTSLRWSSKSTYFIMKFFKID